MDTATKGKTEVCVECAHWNPKGSDEGECRRQPPQAVTFRVDDEVKFETRFPTTKADDWCGEFTRKG